MKKLYKLKTFVMKEENIDSMKYRKSTHLAGIDVDAMPNKVVTIKRCWYETNVNVSGNKTNGYFISFEEPIKDMLVNSTNRKTISGIVKQLKKLSLKDSRNIGNWSGVKIELYFDETIRMMGQTVGGIRVKKEPIKLPELVIDSENYKKVVKALSQGYKIEQIESKYTLTNEVKEALNEA